MVKQAFFNLSAGTRKPEATGRAGGWTLSVSVTEPEWVLAQWIGPSIPCLW